jgi:hypothetical protein
MSTIRDDHGEDQAPTDFQKSGELAGQHDRENFKFVRDDWSLFRTLEGLSQRAGVSKEDLPRLVMKELADNAFDERDECAEKVKVRFGELSNGGGWFIEDDGRGIGGTPQEVAALFSIGRPMVSSKLLRRPTRGAVGNGLRVVAGAVLASEGSLAVITRNRRIELRPERDGTTTVVSIKSAKFPIGTRVEISFGPALAHYKNDIFSWAKKAQLLTGEGNSYSGNSSPHWYDVPHFYELLYASGDRPVRELISKLDGCTGARAGEIVAAAGLGRAVCKDVTREQAEKLLRKARVYARPVNPARLGAIGPVFKDGSYACARGEALAGMYREPRGSIYHPHRDETIPLSTLTVEESERPPWLFNKVLFIEKEGANEALKAAGWTERHDCAPMSSKGYGTRAAKDLIDKFAARDEPTVVFCAHDADAYGPCIYETLQEATKARGARKIKIINIGLEAWEAIEMGLEIEDIDPLKDDKRRPVAKYVREYDRKHRTDFAEWYQTHRVELNAMTTPQLIAWLDRKMAEHDKVGKLIPPPDVLAAELHERVEKKLRASITERILREAGFEDQVKAAVAAVKKPSAAVLKKGIVSLFKQEPESQWRDHVEAEAKKLTEDEQ